MKGEVLRKRYFLLSLENNWDSLKQVERDLFRTFHAKSKFREYPYYIFLTDQFQKNFVSGYIKEHYPFVRIVSVSGTIKKLKSLM